MKERFLHGILFCSLLLFLPSSVAAATYDLGFSGGTRDIFFSKQELVQGDTIRIYASVNNFGTEDVSGHVLFYQGDRLIGESQIVTVRAKGLSDEVYVDFTVPNGSFNIQAKIQAQEPKDENTQNDIALTSVLNPVPPPPPPPPPTPESPVAGGSPSGSSGGIQSGTNVGTGEGVVKKEKVALSIPLPPVRATSDAISVAPIPSIDIVNDFLKLRIEYRERDWNTFVFTAEVNRDDTTTVEWSFGDGATARGRSVTHSFTTAGRYAVSAVATSPNGERAQEKVTLELSFWHFGNWQLWLVLLFLFLLIALLLLFSQKGEKRPPEDEVQDEIKETNEEQKVEKPVEKKRKVVRKKKQP